MRVLPQYRQCHAAKQCATVGAISSPLLLKVADAIVSTEPTQSLSIYQQVISNMLGQSDNKIYRQVIDLCCIYKGNYSTISIRSIFFVGLAVGALVVEQRRKRNFIALIHKHFPSYF